MRNTNIQNHCFLGTLSYCILCLSFCFFDLFYYSFVSLIGSNYLHNLASSLIDYNEKFLTFAYKELNTQLFIFLSPALYLCAFRFFGTKTLTWELSFYEIIISSYKIGLKLKNRTLESLVAFFVDELKRGKPQSHYCDYQEKGLFTQTLKHPNVIFCL